MRADLVAAIYTTLANSAAFQAVEAELSVEISSGGQSKCYKNSNLLQADICNTKEAKEKLDVLKPSKLRQKPSS